MSSTINSNNTMLFSSTNSFKNGLDGDFMKSKDMMPSDLFQQQNSCGLTRYRSAPSTFFASFLDGITANGANTDSSDETENILSAFMNCSNGSSGNMEVRDLNEVNHQLQFSTNLKQESMEYPQQNNGFSSNNLQVVYECSMDGGAGMENQMQGRIGSGNCSNNLIRQSSSPAGFFAGFDVMTEMGSYRAGNQTHCESNSAPNGLNNHTNFASRPPPTSRFMPSIAENCNENIGTSSPENRQMGNGNGANGNSYLPGFANGSWNDSSSSPLKRNRDGDMKMFSSFNGLENQNRESRHITSGLTHHLSLPKTSTEMAAIEQYLQFDQEVVPCKIRAKRGCATHPRSIAERMRRTRISEKMKKLQDLFPNMDKQTNTADMLDLAVEYIKDLQKQVRSLTDVRAKCSCSRK